MNTIKIVATVKNYAQALTAKKNSVDIIELRIDLIRTSSIIVDTLKLISEIKSKLKLPVIVTLRLKSEGGKYKNDSIDRLEFFENICKFADYIDIEFFSKITPTLINWIKKNKLKTKIILSYHNFKNTDDFKFLINLFLKMKKNKPDIIKIATYVKKFDDLMTLLFLQKKINFFLKNNLNQKLALIPMSKKWYSYAGRILLGLLGCELVYGYVDKSVASGQIQVSELSKLIKFLKTWHQKE